MSMPNGQSGDRQELERLLADYTTAVLTTRGQDGHFHARPMGLQRKGISGDEIWLATVTDSQKVQDIEHEPHCGLAFHSTERDSTYLSLSGTADIVRDRQKIKQLWEPSWRVWFPQGVEERDLALIRFVPEHAEYVHPETGRLQVLFTMVRNLVTRTRVEPAPKKELVLH